MAEETKHELVARRLLAHAQRTDIAPESVFDISVVLCDDACDAASTSLLENWIDEAQRRAWFLYETCRG